MPLAADLKAGLVVALVALPLCLGIALASHAPLASGLITGVLGGLIVSVFGGTALLVSGPAAGLAAIVVAAIAELGSFENFLAAVAVAGVLQLGLGALRAGRLADFVPSSVITGMLAAIGVLLILQQAPYLLGNVPPKGLHGFERLWLPVSAVQSAVLGPSLIGLACLVLLVVWDYPALEPVRRRLPGPVAAVGLGALLGLVFAGVPELALVDKAFVELPHSDGGLRSLFAFPRFEALGELATWRVAVTLAVVASLETLLSMEATDRLDPLKRRSDGNRELLGQGLGNLVAGLIGGLPMTGVIVRSSANVTAGGRTWRAAFSHGVVLAVAIVAVPTLLEQIPLAALAAVLVNTGWRLAHPSRFMAAHRVGLGHLLPLAITVVAVVGTDLLVGVFLGLVVAGIATLAAASRSGVQVQSDSATGLVRVTLGTALSFVHRPRLQAAFESVADGGRVEVVGTDTRDFDHDVVEFLHRMAEEHGERDVAVSLVDVPELRGPSTGH